MTVPRADKRLENRSCQKCGAPARVINGEAVHVDGIGNKVKRRHPARILGRFG